jgi:hypothetical protein
MKRIYAALIVLLAMGMVYSSPIDWDTMFDFSGRKGESNLNLSNAVEVMTMETACAYDDMAHAYGFRPAYYQRELFYDIAGDFIEEKFDDTLSILYRNGHRAEAYSKWPDQSSLAAYLPYPDFGQVIFDHAIYDEESLVIEFAAMNSGYVEAYVAELKKLFPEAIESQGQANMFYAGKNSDGIMAAFSLERMAILVERIRVTQ